MHSLRFAGRRKMNDSGNVDVAAGVGLAVVTIVVAIALVIIYAVVPNVSNSANNLSNNPNASAGAVSLAKLGDLILISGAIVVALVIMFAVAIKHVGG